LLGNDSTNRVKLQKIIDIAMTNTGVVSEDLWHGIPALRYAILKGEEDGSIDFTKKYNFDGSCRLWPFADSQQGAWCQF
jgi:hypothetical protein